MWAFAAFWRCRDEESFLTWAVLNCPETFHSIDHFHWFVRKAQSENRSVENRKERLEKRLPQSVKTLLSKANAETEAKGKSETEADREAESESQTQKRK